MRKKQLTKTSQILIFLLAAGDVFSSLNVYELKKKAKFGSDASFRSTLSRLINRGWIKEVDKNAERFFKLTKQGQLQCLIAKMYLPARARWDGKWSMVIFDIPEEHKKKRDLLRKLLKSNNFYQLQASVYISPYALNREAVQYLEQSKLNYYIRIIKIEEMDNDKELLKHFELQR